MTTITVKHGVATMDGVLCTFDSKEIRSEIEGLCSRYERFDLPGKYGYLIIEAGTRPKVAKIIHAEKRQKTFLKGLGGLAREVIQHNWGAAFIRWTSQRVNPEPLYYIQYGYAHDFIMWWGENSKGYTTDIMSAGRYTKTFAESQVKQGRGEFAWPCEYIDNNFTAHRTVISNQYVSHDFRIGVDDLEPRVKV